MVMRTTLNIDEDVATRLSGLARQTGRSLSRVSNEVLRKGLLAMRELPSLPPYDPPVFDSGRPLVDVTEISEAIETLDRG